LILECLGHFYFWAKIAHFSLIFTPESFCIKNLREIALFFTTQIAILLVGENWYFCSELGLKNVKHFWGSLIHQLIVIDNSLFTSTSKVKENIKTA
jgi:hypothetical protein